MATIKNFTDLEAWQQSHQLVLHVYRLVNYFPSREQFILSSQILRSVISISSNIAEGFSRRINKDKTQFYYNAKGSLTELQNQLLIARDLNYLSKEEFKNVAEQSVRVGELITGLIRSLKV